MTETTEKKRDSERECVSVCMRERDRETETEREHCVYSPRVRSVYCGIWHCPSKPTHREKETERD